jgi:hypothetical protein
VHVAAGAGGEAVVAAGAAAVVACPGDAAACARRDCNASIDSRRIDPHRSGPARSGVSNGPTLKETATYRLEATLRFQP